MCQKKITVSFKVDHFITSGNFISGVNVSLFILHSIAHESAPLKKTSTVLNLEQCFSTAGPQPGAGPRAGTGPWYQLYRTARGSPGICHFIFLSNFRE